MDDPTLSHIVEPVADEPEIAEEVDELQSSFDRLMYSKDSDFEKSMDLLQTNLASNMTQVCASKLPGHEKCAFSNITFA